VLSLIVDYLLFKGYTSTSDSMFILTGAGNVGIGTTSPKGRLDVADTLIVFDTGIHVTGRIDCDTLYVGSLGINVPDYVFEPGYVLRDLEQVERFIAQYRHLPGIPSANDRNAWREMSLTQFNKKLLEKVEEQMLYILKQNKRIGELEDQVKEIDTLKQMFAEFKQNNWR